MDKLVVLVALLFLSSANFAQTSLQSFDRLKTTDQKIDSLKAYIQRAVRNDSLHDILIYTEKGLEFSKDKPSTAAYFAYYRGYAFQVVKEYDSAISATRLAKDLYEKDHNLKGEADAMRRLHYIYYYAGRGSERLPMMKKAIDIIDTTTDAAVKSTLTAMLSEYYYDQGLYEKAIEFKLEYITVEKNKLPLSDDSMDDIAVTNSQIAETYLILKEPAKAIEYLHESLKYYRNYDQGKALTISNFVPAFTALNLPESALVYYNRLYQMVKPGDSLFDKLSPANGHLARYYLDKNDTRQALLFATKEFELSVKSKEPIAIMGSHLTLATIFCRMKEFQKALEHLSIAEDNIDAFGREGVATMRYLQAQTYAGLGNWQQAYLKYDAYNLLHDSIIAESSTKNIADAEAKFQNKEKQQQIENKNLQLSAGKKQRLWLIGALALLSIVAVLLVAIYRNKKKTADILDEKNKTLAKLNGALEEANQTKAKLFSIISHDLRSPISQVYQFLKLQQLNPQLLNEQQKNELSNKIQTATGSLLETMEDLLLWSKTQMNEFKASLHLVQLVPVVETCKQLLQLNSDAKDISYKQTMNDADAAHTDIYFLQTILRNLLQNAIKASPQNGIIEVFTKKHNSSISLFINNEGTSFTQEQYLLAVSADNATSISGLGLKLVDELARKINAQVRFLPTVIGGTSVEITFKSI